MDKSRTTRLTKGDLNMFQTVYSGYIKYGPKLLSVHESHVEEVFQIGEVKLTFTEAIEVMADLQKFLRNHAENRG